ncbi:M20/M25/M40 family metallo-hydrolase [Ilumatobacter sp.]|uniref:M20/M25/M40 family metallo-hydrolase n=1 Tax=Ilumatobacter sp. TaxID=1967498 RepID=UPI003AF6893F
MNHRHRGRGVITAFALLVAGAIMPATAAAAPSESGCENRNINQIKKFLACVDADGAFDHLAAFQSFADASGGTRASGTLGYDASVDYVADVLDDAGWSVERQEFSFFQYTEIGASLTVDGAPVETQTFEYSGNGEVLGGNVVPVDLDLGIGNSSTSGCERSDFDDALFTGPADIALVQRGACNFSDKAANAEDAGAEGVIIFNQGNTEGRLGIINGTLGGPVVSIPVIDVSYDDGVALIGTEAVVDMSAEGLIEETVTENVVGELTGANDDNVVMAGAHLDSVLDGPGIQDNGSGSAALLEIAQVLGKNKKYTPQNTLRFAWWGAEESGLIGSFEYFTNADFGLLNGPPEEIARISSYINFDMIASPNFIYGVYDADQSTFPAPVPVPPGSDALEDLFEAYYSIEGIPYEDTEFSGRSDYQVFILLGIPASGLFTGAEVLKTPEQEAIWGGAAGDQFDPCYHLACDTIDNVSAEALDVNIDAVAYAVYNLASTTEAVNGVPGIEPKGITPDDVVFDGPQGTFAGGGGLSAGHSHPSS